MLEDLISDAQRAMRYEMRRNELRGKPSDSRKCIQMESVSGPCAVPDRHPTGTPAHVGPTAIYCAAHCPECNFAMPERTGKVEGLVGVQEGLFT